MKHVPAQYGRFDRQCQDQACFALVMVGHVMACCRNPSLQDFCDLQTGTTGSPDFAARVRPKLSNSLLSDVPEPCDDGGIEHSLAKSA